MTCLGAHSEVMGTERAQAWGAALTGVEVECGGLEFRRLTVREFKTQELEFRVQEEKNCRNQSRFLKPRMWGRAGRGAIWLFI